MGMWDTVHNSVTPLCPILLHLCADHIHSSSLLLLCFAFAGREITFFDWSHLTPDYFYFNTCTFHNRTTNPVVWMYSNKSQFSTASNECHSLLRCLPPVHSDSYLLRTRTPKAAAVCMKPIHCWLMKKSIKRRNYIQTSGIHVITDAAVKCC